MEINVAQLAIFLGSAVILGGLATFGAYHTAKALIAMKKSGELAKIKTEFHAKTVEKPTTTVDTTNPANVTK